MKKIAFGVLITSLIVFALCFLFVLVGIIDIEVSRRIINVFLVLLLILVVVGFAHGGKWLYDEKLNPVDRDYATLVDMRVEKQTAPSRTHLTETDVVLFSTKFGMFELEDNRKIELMLTSNIRSFIEIGTRGLLTYRKNRALGFEFDQDQFLVRVPASLVSKSEVEVSTFSVNSGIFELEDSSLLELILSSKCNVVEVGVQGELIYRNNHALDFIVNGG